MTIPVYGAASLRRTVGFPALIEPLRVAFTEYSHGRAQQVMATLWPGRRPEDGDVLIKAGYLSDIRTAATGALVADLLAPATVTTAGVLGTGTQAYWQARALAHVRPPQRLRIWGRDHGRAAGLANRLAAELPGVRTETVATAEHAVRDSDVVITATSATEPLVAAGWLHPGQHITSVGADDPGKCELEPGVFGRAGLVVVDSRAAAAGNGSTSRALSAGVLAASDLTEIGQLGACPRDPRAITVACLVGIGVQDVVAAEIALARMQAADLAATTRSPACTRLARWGANADPAT